MLPKLKGQIDTKDKSAASYIIEWLKTYLPNKSLAWRTAFAKEILILFKMNLIEYQKGRG